MFNVLVQDCLGTPCFMEAHLVARHSLSLADAHSSTYRSVNWFCLVHMHLVNLHWSQMCDLNSANHRTQSISCCTELLHTLTHLHMEGDMTQQEDLSYPSTWKCSQPNVYDHSTYTTEHFIWMAFRARYHVWNNQQKKCWNVLFCNLKHDMRNDRTSIAHAAWNLFHIFVSEPDSLVHDSIAVERAVLAVK
jgi:hypothetical protein